MYLSYSPSITFEVGFYADPIRVKGVPRSVLLRDLFYFIRKSKDLSLFNMKK